MEVDVQEPFECSECDFKTDGEASMIDHSVTHKSIDQDNYTTVNMAGTHLNSKFSQINSSCQIKEEQNIDEENVIDSNSLGSTHWNKNMKSEDIDIDECGISYNQLTCNDVNRFTVNGISHNERYINKYEYKTLFCQFIHSYGLENSLEIHKYFDFFLEIKKIFVCGSSSSSFHLIICKICNFSSNMLDGQALIYNHVRSHSKDFTITLPSGSCLETIYDYFVCTVCHIRIRSQNDFQHHCQTYNHNIDSNVIVDVKFVENIDSEAKLLHCCELCTFASPKYIDIIKHLTYHNPEQVNTVVRTKYCKSNLIESKRHEFKILNNDILNHTCHNGGMINWRGKKMTEIYINNTGKYIPLGWQRKCFQMGEGVTNVKYKVGFISPFGNIIFNKNYLLKHLQCLEKNSIILAVDVNEMDFSYLSHNLPEVKKKKKKGKKTCKRKEVEVDNKNIYVPEGWQRKLYRSINGSCKGKYFIRYISPFNDEVHDRQKITDYLKSKEKQGIYVSVDMEQLDFTIPYHLHKVGYSFVYRKKVEIQIDNTGKYIPLGWQRKVYQYVRCIRGKCKVYYISPNGKEITCKRDVLGYIKGLDGNGNNTSINVEEMDFKISPYNLPGNANKTRKIKHTKKVECEVDNTN